MYEVVLLPMQRHRVLLSRAKLHFLKVIVLPSFYGEVFWSAGTWTTLLTSTRFVPCVTQITLNVCGYRRSIVSYVLFALVRFVNTASATY